jgi:hypothetical protein
MGWCEHHHAVTAEVFNVKPESPRKRVTATSVSNLSHALASVMCIVCVGRHVGSVSSWLPFSMMVGDDDRYGFRLVFR